MEVNWDKLAATAEDVVERVKASGSQAHFNKKPEHLLVHGVKGS